MPTHQFIDDEGRLRALYDETGNAIKGEFQEAWRREENGWVKIEGAEFDSLLENLRLMRESVDRAELDGR